MTNLGNSYSSRTAAEPKVMQEATKRMVKIIDSDYKKADLKEIAFSAHQLNKDHEQFILLALLKDLILIFCLFLVLFINIMDDTMLKQVL